MKKQRTKLILLLKTELYSFVNVVRHGGEARRRWIGQLIGFSALVFVLFFVAYKTLSYAEEQLDDFFGLVLKFISFFMALGMFMLLRDSIETSMKMLYEREDIPLLMSSPITPATVFGYKLFQIIAANLIGMFIWLLPPWIALAHVFHPSWPFYILLLPTLLLFLVILVTIIAAITMIIIRFFSSRIVMLVVKIVTITVSFLVGVGIALFFVWGLDNIQDIINFLAKSQMPMANWYPHVWVGKFLSSFLPDVKVEPLQWGLLLLATSIFLPAVAILLATRIYYRSWGVSRRIETKPRKKKTSKDVSIKFFTRGRMRAIIVKDFWILIRNKQQMMMIVMLSAIILLAIFIFVSKSAQEQARDIELDEKPKDIWDVLAPITIQIVIYSIIITFGMTWRAFKNEGDVWWILQSAPLAPTILYQSKLIFASVIALVYVEFWVGLALMLLRIPVSLALVPMLCAGIITAVLIAVNVAIGSLPWMAEVGQWKESRNPPARVATYILSMIFDFALIIGVVLWIVLTWGEKLAIFQKYLPALAVKIIAAGIALLFFLGVFIASYVIGEKSLSRLLSSTPKINSGL